MTHRRRGWLPAISLGGVLSTLSIFVDETGSFQGFDPNTGYYGLTLLFHEQKESITEELEGFSLSQ